MFEVVLISRIPAFRKLFDLIEGNFITPYIIGSKINVKPMVVITAMICSALIWGVAGMILALPGVGIANVILSHYEKPVYCVIK